MARDETGIEPLMDVVEQIVLFRPHSVTTDALTRAVGRLGVSGVDSEQIPRRLRDGDPEVVDTVVDAVCIGETYFCRHAEQLAYLEEQALPRQPKHARPVYRAWSAGCSTGEEAYTVAAMLLRALCGRGYERVEVLGTDLSRRRIRVALSNAYGPSSVRGDAPHVATFVESTGRDAYRVREPVRAVTQFMVHNLLFDPPVADGLFDLVICRNVLIYFPGAAARQALDNLAHALAPDGILALGTLDAGVCPPPPDLRLCAPAELQVYCKTPEPSRTSGLPLVASTSAPAPGPRQPSRALDAATASPAERASLASTRSERPSDVASAVQLHCEALTLIERGDRAEALQLLDTIARGTPDYLPAQLERALLMQRMRRGIESSAVLEQLLQRIESLDPDMMVIGPMDLPVSYYRVAVSRALQRAR